MGLVDIKIVSKEMIKPSTPTPNHLANIKCSFLDQIAPSHYIPFILLFQHQPEQNNNHFEITQQLKASLSEALTNFYALAGKVSDDGLSINCDDEGALYLEARIDAKLSDVIEAADYKELNICLPDQGELIYTTKHDEDYGTRGLLLAVQVNVFSCGGIGIGVYSSHKPGDSYSIMNFLKSWAASTSKDAAALEAVRLPKFDSANYFPPRDVTKYKLMTEIPKVSNLIAKRFIFSQSSITRLIRETVSEVPAPNSLQPTPGEVISAFIIKRAMAIRKSPKSPPKRLVASLYSVNLRGMSLNPPLPDESFGNLWRTAFVPPSMLDTEGYNALISKQRKAIDGMSNDDYIKDLQMGKDTKMDIMLYAMMKAPENIVIDVFIFTNWLDYPLYHLDFGFGKPAYVCSPSRPGRNMITLLSTKEADGVEVWVNMTPEDMEAFESDPELLAFTSNY